MNSTSPFPTSYHFNFWNFWMARCPCPPEEQVGARGLTSRVSMTRMTGLTQAADRWKVTSLYHKWIVVWRCTGRPLRRAVQLKQCTPEDLYIYIYYTSITFPNIIMFVENETMIKEIMRNSWKAHEKSWNSFCFNIFDEMIKKCIKPLLVQPLLLLVLDATHHH